ncbi:MAG: DUF1566 domain-containing protein [Deltaproteobacteria bacterium]|nr:DUF1566 domain-containing protein [Deltaproteobacteria bacterium]
MKGQRKAMLILAIVVAFMVAGLSHAGDLDQTAAPTPTMKTLDEIYNGVDKIPPAWSQKLPAAERFVDVFGGEAVLDKETGLVWTKDADLFGTLSLPNARFDALKLEIADRKGWRLPSVDELTSLLDMSQSGSPKVLPGIFNNVQYNDDKVYWTGTLDISLDDYSLVVNMLNGGVVNAAHSGLHYVWPVRAGNR